MLSRAYTHTQTHTHTHTHTPTQGAEKGCGSMEEAKAMLAKHALEQEIISLRRKQPKEQSAAYLYSAPRLIEALEGGARV